MLFTSPVFLCLFLPLVLALHIALPARSLRNAVLLVASIFFYAWGEAFYVGILLASIVWNYCAGLAIARWRKEVWGAWVTGLMVAANLFLLGSYKYANFIVDNINGLLSALQISAVSIEPVHLPIGISFFTFQAISYLVDVHRGTSPVQRNPLDLALYIALFPQLIAGPIIRYHDIDAQIRSRRVTIDDVYFGFRRFVFGLAKKLLIANPLGLVADQIFNIPSAEMSAPLAWLGMLSYSLQLYFDFSAYSCMAIGLGRMFGFRFLENFNYPYISQSIQEFWRRWHISLSNWFRDYLYIALGGNRRGARRTYINLLIVFFLCGLWHGASWNFVVWGLFHGMFLVLERAGLSSMLAKLWRPLRHAYVLLVVMIGWVFFRSETLPYAIEYMQALAGMGEALNMYHDARFFLTPDVVAVLILACVFSAPVWPAIERWIDRPRLVIVDPFIQLCSSMLIFAMMGLCLIQVFVGAYNPFIYFRF